MPTATFPSYIRLLKDGFAEEPDSAVLRTDVESGPAKQLRTKSRVTIGRPVTCVIDSKANYLAFRAWHKDDINYGADWFNWFDPVAAATVLARIVGGKIKAVPENGALTRWRVSFNVETWSA